MTSSFIHNEDAVNIEIGYILSLIVLMIFTGSITTVFYQYADSSSQQSMRTGSADLGSEIARDITNMYLTTENSPNNINLSVTRDIPLTLGGRGYKIELNNNSATGRAAINIDDGSLFSYPTSTTLNSINSNDINRSIVYSGSGKINIIMSKINNEMELCIK
ncbi:hypothetical protein METP3_00130 [Methanosarcinales archaeon]|nr:hypothetical protein METP3_00130 [Methanosarcinales archaeon]